MSLIFRHHHHQVKLSTYHDLGSCSHLFVVVSQMNVNHQDIFNLPSTKFIFTIILVLVPISLSLIPKLLSIPNMSLIFRHHHHLLELYTYHNLGSCSQHILVVSQMNINHQDVFTLPSSNLILNIVLVLVAISLSLFPKWMSITKMSLIFRHQTLYLP